MQVPLTAVPVYILAGGQSRRFGSDKARALIDGVPLIVRQWRVLQSLSLPVVAVADIPNKYADLGITTIADHRPGLGPMGGLLTALRHARGTTEWILVSSCDLLLLHSPWLNALLQARDDAADIVAFRDDRWQPLPALYRTSLLGRVEALIESRRLAMGDLFDGSRVNAPTLPADWPKHLQANSPTDLAAFRAANGHSPN